MSEKKLELRPVPRQALPDVVAVEGVGSFKYKAIPLGTGPRPPFLLVLRGAQAKQRLGKITAWLNDVPSLSGCPVVWLPDDCDAELYEIERDTK